MALVLHPHVVDVLNVADDLLDGHSVWELFDQVLAQMAETHQWQRERFDFFRQGQKRTSESQRLASLAETSFELRGQSLATLQTLAEQRVSDGLAEAVEGLLRASQRIAKETEELDAEDGRHRLSPLPLLNDFLQAGFNVYGEHEPADILKARLGPLAAWISSLESDWAGECELFESLRERHGAFEEAIDLLKTGVGAVVTYQESGEASDLLAALVYLQEGGEKTAEFVRQARRDAADLASYSNFREIERYAVRRARLGPEDAATQEARQQVEQLLEALHQRLADLAELPFDSEEFSEAMAVAESHWSRMREALEGEEIELLGEASTQFQASLDGLAEPLGRASADLEEAPALQELRRAVLGVYYNQIPRRFLRELLRVVTPGFQALYEGEQDPQVRESLAVCLQAFEAADVGLQEGAAEAFIEAYRGLNEGGAQVIAIQRQRQVQEEALEESRKVSCTQCGTRQEPAPACSQCGARLIRPQGEEMTSSVVLTEGASEEPSQPSSLRELNDLIGRIREGVAGPEDIAQVVDPLRGRAQTLLHQASQAGADEGFVSSVQRFAVGLEGLASQAQERNLERLDMAAEILTESSDSILSYAEKS